MDDKKIIDLYFQRDETAIMETDKSYGRKLHSISEHILRNYHDAQECVNDTYYRSWNSIPPQIPKYLFAYLASICRLLSLNKLDWNTALKRNAEIISLTHELELCIPDKIMDSKFESRELRRILNSFLGTLTAESRAVFLRRYWYADSVSEIADHFGYSESKVKMQLSRTRKKLKNYLAKEGMTI